MGKKWVLFDPTKETQSDKLTTEEAQFAILRLKTKLVTEYLIWCEEWPKWKKLNAYLDSRDCPFMYISNGFEATSVTNVTAPKPALKMHPAPQHVKDEVQSSFEFSEVRTQEVSLKEALKSRQHFNVEELTLNTEVDFLNAASTTAAPNLNFKGLNKVNAFGKRTVEDKYKIELLLIDSKGGQMFRTAARDISLTGTFVEKNLPGHFHTGSFDIVVINNMINDDLLKRVNLKGQCVITDNSFYVQFTYVTPEQKAALRAGLDYYIRAQKKIATAG